MSDIHTTEEPSAGALRRGHLVGVLRQRDRLGAHQPTLDAVPAVSQPQGAGLESQVDLVGYQSECLLKSG